MGLGAGEIMSLDNLETSRLGNFCSSRAGNRSEAASGDMYFAGNSPTFSTGKYGDAMVFTLTTDIGFQVSDYLPSRFSLLPFTIRLWFKPGVGAYSFTYPAQSVNSGGGGNGYVIYYSRGGAQFALEMKMNYGDGLTFSTITDGVYRDVDQWYRLRVWVDPVGLGFGYQVDLEAEVTGTMPHSPDPDFPFGFTMGGSPVGAGANEMHYDEVGVWHNKLWSGAESIADYAAGAGVTWPGVISAVNSKPALYFRMDAADWSVNDGSEITAASYSKMRNLA